MNEPAGRNAQISVDTEFPVFPRYSKLLILSKGLLLAVLRFRILDFYPVLKSRTQILLVEQLLSEFLYFLQHVIVIDLVGELVN